MREKIDPTILAGDTLMCRDGVFMTKELVRDSCRCKNDKICLAIIDLLNNNKVKESLELLDNIEDRGGYFEG